MKRILGSMLLLCLFGKVYTQTNVIGTTGNVGIGTTSPSALLHLNGAYKQTSPTYTGNFGIDFTANGTVSFSSQIGTLFTAGPGNIITFGNQELYATAKGAYFSHSFGGSALETYTGNIRLNLTSGNTLIGTGTDDATNKLQVNGSIKATGLVITTGAGAGKVLTSDASGNATWQTAGSSSGWSLNGSTVGVLKSIGTVDNFALPIITNNVERMRVGTNGSIGIGTTNINDAGYKLFVETGIRTRKVKVDQLTWSDYVFYPSYKLPSLAEVEKYIQQNNHLPDVPSAAEVEKEGIDLGSNQAILLKKIEELTLYVIAQQKEIDALKKQVGKQSK